MKKTLSRLEKRFRAILLASGCAAFSAQPLRATVVLDAPGHVVIEGHSANATRGKPGEQFFIVDWRGRPIGIRGAFDGEGNATLPPLPTGYYTLETASTERTDAARRSIATFAVVPPPETRAMDGDSFYGVDSAQSGISRKGTFYCPWNGGDTFRTVSDLIALAGVPRVRERTRWTDVNPHPGEYAFEGSVPMRNAELLHERGIRICGLYCAPPAWAKKFDRLPADLNEIFESCAAMAAAFGDRISDWEFWNEPDIGNEPVWDYAAALKAGYLGLKAGSPAATILPGALCRQTPFDIDLLCYARVLYENDAAKFGDAFNFHTYNSVSSYPKMLGTLRNFMARNGITGKAVWMTENGTHLEGRAHEPGRMKGFFAHTPEQELVKAEFYPKSQVLLQMEGIAKSYYFVFGAYNEYGGTKDWGILRRDGTVKPEYAAISTMTRELVSARLEGEMSVGDGRRAFLFRQPDGSQTVVYWSVSPLETQKDGVVPPAPDFSMPLSITAPNGLYRLSDLCGVQSTALVTNGVLSLESTRFPAYASGFRELRADKPPLPAGESKPYEPKVDEDLSVIVRADLDAGDFDIAAQKSRAVLKGDSGRIRFQVWNMDDYAKTGFLEVSGAAVSGLPAGPVVLGPRGGLPAQFDCTLEPGNTGEAFDELVVTGVFDGRRSSRLAIPLCFEKIWHAGCEARPLDWQDPGDWNFETSASTCKVSWDDAEQAIRFDMAWADPAVSRWFRAEYGLKSPREDIGTALRMEFEEKSLQDKVENDFGSSMVMLGYGDSERPQKRIDCPAPVASWERRSVELKEEFDLPHVKTVCIGGDPRGMNCTFWIRAVNVIKSEGTGTKTAIPTGQGVRQSETVSEKPKDEQDNE